jgi:nitroreductase
LGKKELDQYYRDYYDSVEEGLTEWQQNRRDLLFHGATAAIVVGSKPGASCPAEDALLATGNILLTAHAMGLGTCLVGFAVSAMQESPAIKRFIGIPDDEIVYAVIALGYSTEKYRGLAGRKKPVVRVFAGRETGVDAG